jgi:anti-sigma regulatory factor (Ser/Thr protein kinase)
MRNIKETIFKKLCEKKEITSTEIAKLCKISRQAAHAYLFELVKAKKIIRIGKTRGAYYVLYSKRKAKELQEKEERYYSRLKNKGLEEDRVYERIKYSLSSISKLAPNARDILHYAFTEMLNNAIEHSGSLTITVLLLSSYNNIYFEVIDKGIGIFKHIQKKFRLNDEYVALEELLKGKRTTMPDRHTGEGIFFTSKSADIFQIQSSKIKLIINNQQNDIYTEEIPFRQGTKICFQLKKKTRRSLEDLFRQYISEDYNFQKTKVAVQLYQKDTKYISRSQARRLILGLDKFKVIVLDFNKVKTIGQSFADEIFRVFQNKYPNITIETINCCRAVDFMIRKAKVK